MTKTIIVSNRLPVKIQRKENSLIFKPSEGGLATGLGSIYKEGNNLWVGWPGLYIDEEEEKNFVVSELEKESMYPVFLTKDEIKDYYEGFSNATLWPTFHYFNQYVVYKSSFWEAYKHVNGKFCEVLSKVAHPGDTIWVHDYQLLLLPQMLRVTLHDCLIGFFQHIPFPSYEVFRMLPWREIILKGMLGADLIGFHTYDDTRHFLNSVNRLIGNSDTNGQLEIDNRYVLVDAFPMGIDYKKYSENVLTEQVQQNEKTFRKSLGDQKLVLSIDRLDYSKGIPQKLSAFEKLLDKNPKLSGAISLVMIVVPSRHHVERYKALKEEIDEMVGRINSKFSTIEWRPIYYFYRSFPLDHLSALYHMADIGLITPMRDGMNLVAKEYVASKVNKKGVLILSEMAGAAKELSDAIIINPNDTDAIVAALEKAISMSDEEQDRLMGSMQNIVRSYDIHNWVELFLERLKYIGEKQKSTSTLHLDEKQAILMMQKYHHSDQRLILIDLDDSLLVSDNFPLPAQFDRSVYRLLKTITSSPKNKVICITGADINSMESWFNGLPIDMVAEHGMWIKRYGQKWEIYEDVTNEWKYEIFPTLEHFVKRTPGSFIEEKDFSLVWHYKKAAPGLGEMRTRELTGHLKQLVANMDLSVLEGFMIVEIKSSLINKGRVLKKWLEGYNFDFIFALGGNSSEDLFKVLPSHAFSIKTGRRQNTHAKYILLKRDLLQDIFQFMALKKEYNLS